MGTVLERTTPAATVPERAWLTATIRPAGTFGRNDATRLRVLLDALSACRSSTTIEAQAERASSNTLNRVASLRPKVPAGRIVAVSHAVSGIAEAGVVRARRVPVRPC